MKLDDCKGCNLYGLCYGIHVLKCDNSKCPCMTCLIKGICNQRCTKFTRFRTNIKDDTIWK
jgi:hypothetical protein